ncbi:MAG TPA: hypothetical protein VI521_00655 [Candidatus Babeliales bacterium]|nr:hypothetical protein [Candidatus Babeliales bacterium]
MIQKANKPFGEVIESSLQHFTAQTWQWDNFPAYGSLVSIEQKPYTYIGLVYEVSTGSIDPSRSPFAYQKTESELKKDQPQIFEFLKTTFSCITLGSMFQERCHYTAPAHPAKIHSFVSPTSSTLSYQFLARPLWIQRLFSLSGIVTNVDELLLAVLAEQQSTHFFDAKKLQDFMQTYSLLTANDYRRIKLFLGRAAPYISQ